MPSRNAAHRFILWARQKGHISLGRYQVKEADINVLQQRSSELTLTTTLNKEMGSGTDSQRKRSMSVPISRTDGGAYLRSVN